MCDSLNIEIWIDLLIVYQSQSQLSFHERREILDSVGFLPARDRKRKWSKNLSKEENEEQRKQRRLSLQSLGTVSSHKDYNEKRPLEWSKPKAREKYVQEYPNAIIDLNTFKSYDQEHYCACSFISLLTMMKMYNKEMVISNWKKKWENIQSKSTMPEGTEDIGSTLDLVTLTQYLDLTGIIYFPIRSIGNNELKVHPYLVVDGMGGSNSQNGVIARIGAIIECLITSGRPVMVNFNEHTRVAIAFNDTHILFADSWGDDYYRETDGDYDIYSAGFSTVAKKNIYRFCRDICFYRRRLEETENEQNEQKQSPKPRFKQHVKTHLQRK